MLKIKNPYTKHGIWPIPDYLSPESKAFYEEHNRKVLARKERLAAERKERAAQRKADNEGILDKVKVGDVFSCSWGYEQTNVDFFQVIEKVGKNSVRIKEVCPPILENRGTGPFSADRTYDIPSDGTLLPVKSHSVHIKDQQNGDVKRVQAAQYYEDKRPYIRIASYADAYLEKPGKSTHYESWGY